MLSRGPHNGCLCPAWQERRTTETNVSTARGKRTKRIVRQLGNALSLQVLRRCLSSALFSCELFLGCVYPPSGYPCMHLCKHCAGLLSFSRSPDETVLLELAFRRWLPYTYTESPALLPLPLPFCFRRGCPWGSLLVTLFGIRTVLNLFAGRRRPSFDGCL